MAEVSRVILVCNPTQARFMPIRAEPDARPTTGDLRQAIQRGAAVVRVMLPD
jgi:hypothetical protein